MYIYIYTYSKNYKLHVFVVILVKFQMNIGTLELHLRANVSWQKKLFMQNVGYALASQAFTSKQLLLLLPSTRSICSTFIPTTDEYFGLQESSVDKNLKIFMFARVVFTLISS